MTAMSILLAGALAFASVAVAADTASDVAKVDVVNADFRASQVMGDGAWDRAMITATTPGGKMFYACGEEMSFSLKLEGVKEPLPDGVYFVDWERCGDDGVTEKGREPLPFRGGRFVYRTRGLKPGFVRLEANVVTADGRRVKKNHRWEPRVFFMGGAGVEPEKIPMAPEPADYDAFWRESLAELAAVPIKAELKPVSIADPLVKCFAVRIPCAGPCPVTGYLTIPAAASAANRMPANAGFRGASQQEQLPPEKAPHDRISLCINPNGYELGRGPEYVKKFFEGLSEDGKGYGMGPNANRNRGTSYWKYCALRAIRSVQWIKTLPEWNGRSLFLSGGSQGDWQAYHAAANVPGVTSIYANGSWGADWGGQEAFGRLKSSYRPSCWFPDMAYFDPIYAARRISCPVRIVFSGLGDYCSTPASLTLLYRNLKGPKSITYVQGSTHGWRPAGQQSLTIDDGLASKDDACSARDADRTFGEALLLGKDVAYRLDASAAGTVEVSAGGAVTAWRAAAGRHVFSPVGAGRPRLSKIGERTAVFFDGKVGARLVAAKAVEHRTVFVVCRPGAGMSGFAGVWGAHGADAGLRLTQAADAWENVGGGPDFNTAETLFADGRFARGNVRLAVGAVQVLALRHPEDREMWNARAPAVFRPSVGGYLGRRNFNGDIAEIAAFRRVLSDAECRSVAAALAAKWRDGERALPDAAEPVRSALARGERLVKVPRAAYRLTNLDLRGLSDVAIDFSGSELTAATGGPLVSLVGCTNVSVREAKIVFPPASEGKRIAVSARVCEECSFERLEVSGAACAFDERESCANEYRGCRVRMKGEGFGFSVRGAAAGPRLLGCAASGAASVAVVAEGGENPDVRGLVADGCSIRLDGTGGRLEDSVFARGCRVKTGSAVCRANETFADEAPFARTDPMAYVRNELARGQRRISVPRARYWLAPNPDEAAYFHLARRADAEIDFNGGELVGTVQATMFTLSDCTNVTVRGVSVDYSDLPFTQAVIERVDAERNWDVRAVEGYPRPRPAELDVAGDFWPIQAYGAKSHEPVNYMRYRQNVALERTGADTYRVTGGECRKGETGDVVVWSRVDRTRPHRRGVVNVWSSADCRIEDVDAFAAPNNGCAFAEALATGNVYASCRLVRRAPETDLFPRALRRLRSGNHDAFNSRRSPRGPTLEGCVFQYHCDDCVNISGFYVLVLSCSGRTLRIADYAQERLRVGDLCQVQTPDGEALPDVRIVREASAAPLSAAEKAGFAGLGLWPGCENNFTAAQEVTLDREVDLPPGSLLAPRGRMGDGFAIRRCTMGHNRARGLLVKASDGVIESNTLEGVEGWAVLMAPECNWMESGCGSNLRLVGNVCCGNGDGIHIGGRSLKGRPLAASTRSNVRIEGNLIEGGNVAVTGCRGLVVDRNDIRPRSGQRPVVRKNVESADRAVSPD